MPENKTPTPVVDLITRILGVDLSTPRNLDLMPVPEGHIVLGVLSENAQKALCFGFDTIEEISKIKQEILTADEAHMLLHTTNETTKELCAEHKKAMNLLEVRIEGLRLLKNAAGAVLSAIVSVELHEAGKTVPHSVTFNEGFVVSVPPTPTLTEMTKDILSAISEFEKRFAEEELSEDEDPAEGSTAEEPAENSEAISANAPATEQQPADAEELVSPEKP